MRIFEKKLIGETAYYCVTVLVVTGGVFGIVKFVGLLRRAVRGQVPIDGLETVLFLKMLSFLDVIITPVLYIAILLVLTRWNRDNEITIYAASGIGPTGYLISSFVVALAATFVVAFLSFYTSPYAERMYERELANYRHSVKLVRFDEGRFRTFGGGRNMVYYGQYKDANADPFRLLSVNEDKDGHEIVTAESGSRHPDPESNIHKVQVGKGIRYRLRSNSPTYEITKFDSYDEWIPVVANRSKKPSNKGLPTLALIRSGKTKDISELFWRISKVLTVPIVVLFAFVLGSSKMESRASVNLISAILIYFVYTSLLGFVSNSITNGSIVVSGILWVPHVAMVGLAVWIILRSNRNKAVLPAIFSSRF